MIAVTVIAVEHSTASRQAIKDAKRASATEVLTNAVAATGRRETKAQEIAAPAMADETKAAVIIFAVSPKSSRLHRQSAPVLSPIRPLPPLPH